MGKSYYHPYGIVCLGAIMCWKRPPRSGVSAEFYQAFEHVSKQASESCVEVLLGEGTTSFVGSDVAALPPSTSLAGVTISAKRRDEDVGPCKLLHHDSPV